MLTSKEIWPPHGAAIRRSAVIRQNLLYQRGGFDGGGLDGGGLDGGGSGEDGFEWRLDKMKVGLEAGGLD